MFNQFLMLSNTQFIENRVYEDKVPIVEDEKTEEEAAAAVDGEKDKTTEQRQAEIIPKFTQAMKGGLATLDASFTKMFETPEDVDEDDDELPEDYEPDLILEPHNPYKSRQLPNVIGTSALHARGGGVCRLYAGPLHAEVANSTGAGSRFLFFNIKY